MTNYLGWNFVNDRQKKIDQREQIKNIYKSHGATPKEFNLWTIPGNRPEQPMNKATIIILGGIKIEDKVTSEPYIFHRHAIGLAKSRRTPLTCSGKPPHSAPCFLCEKDNESKSGGYAKLFGAFTIIDTREYHIPDEETGKVIDYKNMKRLVCLPFSVLKSVGEKTKKRGGNLIGAKLDITRTDSKKPSCGDDWDFLGYVDLNTPILNGEGKPVDTTPFEYSRILAPFSYEEQRILYDYTIENLLASRSQPKATEESKEEADVVPF